MVRQYVGMIKYRFLIIIDTVNLISRHYILYIYTFFPPPFLLQAQSYIHIFNKKTFFTNILHGVSKKSKWNNFQNPFESLKSRNLLLQFQLINFHCQFTSASIVAFVANSYLYVPTPIMYYILRQFSNTIPQIVYHTAYRNTSHPEHQKFGCHTAYIPAFFKLSSLL